MPSISGKSDTSLEGHFSDGKSAARHPVELRFALDALEIRSGGGAVLARWRYCDIELIDALHLDQPVRFSSVAAPDARLTIEDRETLERLSAAVPGLLRRRRYRPVGMALLLALTAVAAAFVAVLGFALPRLVEPLAGLIPVEWEESIGAAAADQLVAALAAPGGGGYCAAPEGAAALGRLTGRLAETVDTPFRFRVRVADSEMVNAFAVQGGNIVLLRGLIEAAESPQEVAGVLAHEMGHVIERHPTEAMLRHLGFSALLTAFFGDTSSILGQISALLLAASYSRADEAEADALALRILSDADIRSGGLADFFQRLTEEQGDDSPLFLYLSTHPPSATRLETAGTAGGGRERGMSPAEWAALKAICRTTAPPRRAERQRPREGRRRRRREGFTPRAAPVLSS